MQFPFIPNSYYEMTTKWIMVVLALITIISSMVNKTWNAIAFFAGLIAVLLVTTFTGSMNQSIFQFNSPACGGSIIPWTTAVYSYVFSYMWYTMTMSHTAIYNLSWIIAGVACWMCDVGWLLSANCYGLREIGTASVVGVSIGLLWANVVFFGQGKCSNTGKHGPSSVLFNRM